MSNVMGAIARERLQIEVGDVAPRGVDEVAATVVRGDPGAPIVVCTPGGGMSSRYFDLPLAGYSMLEHLAGAGLGVVLLEPPGTEPGNAAVDGYELVPSVVARINAAVVARLPLDRRPLIGLGHSMGAMLTVVQQADHRSFDALALLGYSGRGLPEVLTPDELDHAGRESTLSTTLGELAARRFRRPLIGSTTTASEFVLGVEVEPEARAALDTAAAPLLACCGLASMIPGSHASSLAAIDVPVFCALAEFDIAGPPHTLPGTFTGTGDITFHLLPRRRSQRQRRTHPGGAVGPDRPLDREPRPADRPTVGSPAMAATKKAAPATAAGGRSRAVLAADYLDRVTLIRVAADLADEIGWSKLTLSAVAKHVDRHVTSLYAHVDSLAALRREVALLATDELAEVVWQAVLARTREDALRAIAAVYRAFSLDHPGRAAAILSVDYRRDPVYSAKAARLAEPVQATLRSFGLDDAQVHVAHRVFSATVRGLTLAVNSDEHTAEAEHDETFDQAIALFGTALSGGHWPR